MTKFSFLTSAIFTFIVGATSTFSGSAQAQVFNGDFTAVPPESTQTDAPLVMLTMSRDHQYFFQAYNDFTDLDPEDLTDVDANGNPNVETTYKHTFDYFGYFDANKCYDYSGANTNPRPAGSSDAIFVPVAFSADKYCTGDQWSGNFLNWASMTRMDIVRSIFYGGKRSTDDANRTVIERAHLTMDAHSFAKYYNGNDIARLTPYDTIISDTNGGNSDGIDNLNEGITICNTTFNPPTGASQDSTRPPLMRVVAGNYQLWNSNERWQCTYDDAGDERGNSRNDNIPPSDPLTITVGGTDIEIDSGIDAHSSDPDTGDDYIVRVEVCKEDLIGTERCKQYPQGSAKPIGLLQTYGDNDIIRFGLMTGSYENNIEGGVLRKNITNFADEVNVTTDGTFSFTGTSESIVRTLDNLRVWGYRYSDGTYRGGGDFDNCSFQLNEIPNGRCNSWGNPISETYRESVRYLAGLAPDADFVADDTTFITGLRTETWNNPLTENNQCADLSTILINASVSSYDDNQVDISDVIGGINGDEVDAGDDTTTIWTDDVGRIEGISATAGSGVTPQQFFIGRNGTNNNEACSAKPVSRLSQALGLCPEAPTVNGSFAMAGIAYYAHNNDLRPDLDGNQTLNTYAISLATNTPTIRVPRVNGPDIELLPAYRNLGQPADPGGGALVDFRIVQPHTRQADGTFTGRFYVNWEDSEQGGDYDQDMWGLIEYSLNEAVDQITITTTAVAESTTTPQLFGFVATGTTQDGFHAYSGIEGATLDGSSGVPGCNNCQSLDNNSGGQRGPQSHTFELSSTVNASNLESPLYYAAKYGGFEENLADGETVQLTDAPDEVEEWDAINNTTGLEGPDGLPDDFFFVINPENLFNSLESSLNEILSEERAASSSVASFANSNGFGNIIIQGTYQELLRDSNLDEVEWSGELFSFFIDDFGLFRADNQTNGTRGTLDDYVIDRAFRYDVSGDVPRIQFLSVDLDSDDEPVLVDGAPVITPDGSPIDIGDLDTLWNAGDRLRSINNALAVEQRTYTNPFPSPNAAQASRYIFSYIDSDLDGRVDVGEQIDFTTDSIDEDNFGFFGVGSEEIADDIVNYIRGFEDPTNNFRNRTLSIDDPDDTIYRLGDLVNSTPLVVAGPNAGYDIRFGNESYAEFRELYEDRRQVAYVGANDGLLHAFNAGFRDSNLADIVYETSPDSQTDHPLGAEIWAYAPFNLLPHLQWLASPTYNHVFYVDGSPQSFDVRLPDVFTDTTRNPGHWGTILVVGMRLGGGDFPVVNGDDSTTLRSAYVVLDITDPENEPRVLAEINAPDLNLTTSEPDVFYDCDTFCDDLISENDFDGDWKLVFGSGPNNIRSFTSTESAKVFTYDLNSRALEQVVVEDPSGNPVDNSFVGNVAVRDWDNGVSGFRNDDVVYFGTVGTTLDTSTANPTDVIETGAVYRYRPSLVTLSNRISRLIDVDRPVVQAPVLINGEPIEGDVLSSWAFFATGIYLNADNEETFAQERIYGVIEPVNSAQPGDEEDSDLLNYGPVTISQLVDVSGVTVLNNDDGSLGPDVSTGDLSEPISGAGEAETDAELSEFIFENSQGWFRDLPLGSGVVESPSSRVVDRIVPFREQLFFTAFTPDPSDRLDICIGGEGLSELFVVDQANGVPAAFGTLGFGDDGEVNESVLIGDGAASAPVIFTSEALGANDGTIIIQREDGSLTPLFEPEGSGGPGDGNPFDDTVIGTSEILRSSWFEIFQ